MVIFSGCVFFLVLVKGKEIYVYVIKNNLVSDVAVGSVLVDMYVKCGCLNLLRKVFDEMLNKNVIIWNVFIMFYGMYG